MSAPLRSLALLACAWSVFGMVQIGGSRDLGLLVFVFVVAAGFTAAFRE